MEAVHVMTMYAYFKLREKMEYRYFMEKALDRAENALAEGEFPVGCVMVYQGKILVDGSRKGTIGAAKNEIDHAEMAALRRLNKIEDNIDPGKITVFSTMEPCLMCYGALILAGVGEIVFAYEDVMGGATDCELSRLKPLYKNSAVRLVPGVLRAESLKKFKTYFSNPANSYWKQSLLAEYTLGQ
jgi:tRNA(adenine34) deaminase